MLCKDRVALVTGAAGKGMGRSTALTLAREGASVALNYRTSEKSANAIVSHILAHGGSACAIQADIQEKDGCEALVESTLKTFGRIDICIVGPGGGWHMESIDRLDADSALSDVTQELAPIYYLMPLILPGMYERQWGRFITISLEPSYDSPAYAYNVAKSVRSNALLLAQAQAWQHGVTMNIIGPGPVPEILTLEEAIEQSNHGSSWDERTEVSPQDIAETVTFLCSEAGRFISGGILPFK